MIGSTFPPFPRVGSPDAQSVPRCDSDGEHSSCKFVRLGQNLRGTSTSRSNLLPNLEFSCPKVKKKGKDYLPHTIEMFDFHHLTIRLPDPLMA